MNSSTTATISGNEILADGRSVKFFDITAASGAKVRLTDLGARICRMLVPDRVGQLQDVVLGFAKAQDFLDDPNYLGTTVGRVAGRIPNASFQLGDRSYQLCENDGKNHVHGGLEGYDKCIWDSEIVTKSNGDQGVRFALQDLGGHEGYPGGVKVTVTYHFTGDHCLEIDISGATDQVTPFCPTNHAYFNLSGMEKQVFNHELQIHSNKVIEVDEHLIATGKVVPVAEANDLSKRALLGDRIDQLHLRHGDMYVLPNYQEVEEVATLYSPDSGILMKVATNSSHLQLYTGMGLSTSAIGWGGDAYQAFGGLCLECQGAPAAAVFPELDNILIRPNESFNQKIQYKLSVE